MRLRGPVKEGSAIKASGDILVFSAGFPPIYGQQLLYFQNPEWLSRAALPWPDRSDELPEAGKDYEIVFGPSKGILSVPKIEKKEGAGEARGKIRRATARA